ncbi:hypothetical protein [Promicromonospora panici]|uniref:hypothetical protein n=1 Tax=Promicromonospora panici TaxID=2219658 RepID=UPI00101DA494|nr:hypothetical protein [Promicromonospora panici]
MSLTTASSLDGGLISSVCRTYGGPSTDGWYTRTRADGGEYSAVVDHPALPGALETTGVRICRGAAVDLADQWAFFDDLAPAAAFVHAGRMSNMRASWDLFEAAEVRAFCPEHRCEEAALLLGRQVHENLEIHGLVARFAATLPEVPDAQVTR